MQNIPTDLLKDAVKEALSEWLDKQFAKFGRWGLGALASVALAGLVTLAVRYGK